MKFFRYRAHGGFTKCAALKFLIILISAGCSRTPDDNAYYADLTVKIKPDYSQLIIPSNIAPLNFRIEESGIAFFTRISSSSGKAIEINSANGRIQIPRKKWSALLEANKGHELKTEIFIKDEQGGWVKYKEIANQISVDPVDPYLYYRLLYPGYESWSELSINRRDITDFNEEPLLLNTVADDNCINCHSFNNGNSDDFLFHMRGSLGGTYFYSNGEFRKINLKTREMKNGAVYPRWHPSGRYVAFSANKIAQRFHAADNKKVEVSDLESSLVLYDVESNEMMDISLDPEGKFMDTYPEWSPDGKYLYFCRTARIAEEFDYMSVRYDLYRTQFNPSDRTTGQAELVFNAAATNSSVAFPRISPDGNFLVFTLADYGCFPIWHREADLYSLDLRRLTVSKLGLNSDCAESYHSWSSNGRWLVFSSKRVDGLTARPYIAWFDENGSTGKPFILPQEDPDFYDNFLKTYNIPEFSNTRIDLRPGEIRRLAKSEAKQAKWFGKRLTVGIKAETK